MAVTIESTPNAITPTGNPITYTFSSDQTGQPNFSFIVETYVNLVKVREEKVFPERSNVGHVDISETVDALCSAPAVLDGLNNNASTRVVVSITVRENYGTPPTNQASASSSITQAFKGCISNSRFETVDFNTDWVNKKWLTNVPNNEAKILRNQVAIAKMLVTGSKTIYLEFYDSSGTNIHSYSASNLYTVWQINVSQANLLASTGISAFTLSQTAYFTVQIDTSEILTFRYLDDYCYSPKALLWVNEYGSFDTFVFTHNDMRSGSVEASTYRRQYGEWSGTDFEYNQANSGRIDYSKTKTVRGELISGYMREQTHTFLTELYNSPFYLLYDADGNNPDAIRVTGRSWKIMQDRFDDLIDEKVQYELSNTQNSVRR
jgi:ribosomal protein S17E